MPIEFSTEIRAGDIAQIVTISVLGVATFFNLRNRLNLQDLRLDWIDAAIEDAKRELKASATTDWRLIQVEEKVKELAHWKGFVNPDGEYSRDGTKKPFNPTV